MKRFVTIIILCAGCLLTAGAQTFTQRIQQKGHASEGTVTVSHSKAIDDLVNATSGEQKEKEQEKDKEETTPAKPINPLQEARRDTTDLLTIDTRRKVMKGTYKVNGYRVQAFAGGNQRKDRQSAERVGNTIKAVYPEEPIYVHFYSPRWICRVGNYRTYEEAHQMLINIRKLGIQGASIVKGKITVPY